MASFRKIVDVGTSRAVTLPSKWLTFQEQKSGGKIKTVLVEENANSLLIIPQPQKQQPPEAQK